MMADCIAAGGVVHVFGSGHSHMMAEEVFHRAGGLFAFNAMLDINLTSFGTLKAGMVERTEGYATVMLDSFDVRPGEVVVVVSNSGINPVPIELAIDARSSGDITTIAMTSAEQYASAASRHSSGKKLATWSISPSTAGCRWVTHSDVRRFGAPTSPPRRPCWAPR